jgi:hypothetical protein
MFYFATAVEAGRWNRWGQIMRACVLYAIAYNEVMRTASYSDLRKNLAAMLDSVQADRDP